MGRTSLINLSQELQSDDGAVLWSIIQGERLEFEVVLDFIEHTGAGYSYEAVVVEGANDGAGSKPVTVEPAGIQTTLNVRVPPYTGTWSAANTYSRFDTVLHNDVYYIMGPYTDYNAAIAPDQDPVWSEWTPNKIYIQFPETLSQSPAWAIQPVVNLPVYGFFELAVYEAGSAPFPRIWKPMRGMVELHYSPTNLVPGP